MDKGRSVSSGDSMVTVPMAGGDSPYSYASHSTFQRGGLDSVKALIKEEIAEKLDLKQLLDGSKVFDIADLGCSIGPNTFAAVDSIIEAIESKRRSEGRSSESVEYRVYFSDHTENDFNTLFRSMPQERLYFATGVPGNFYRRIFPKASLHFVNCSYAIHWLSRAPEYSPETDSKRNICVGNKGVKEYRDQFANDMDLFLKLRAEEIAVGGFLALLTSGIPRGANPEDCEMVAGFKMLVTCLADMAKMGIIEEAKVDSFRMPIHWPSPEELEEIAGRSRYFEIEQTEELAKARPNRLELHALVLGLRATVGQLITEHFGNEIVDELFNLYEEKLVKFNLSQDPSFLPVSDVFIFLRRVDAD